MGSPRQIKGKGSDGMQAVGITSGPVRRADDYSGWGNEVLYQMCRDAPGHKSIDVVASKLWLIGRSYAAQLERGAGENFHPERAAWLLIRSDFDRDLKKTEGIKRPCLDNLGKILEVHKRLVDLLAESLPPGCKRKIRRSLASKYLHFHKPDVFFLYDSISSKNLRKRLGRDRPACPDKLKSSGDPMYAEYVVESIHFRDQMLEPLLSSQQASPRRVDMELQHYAGQTAAYIEEFRSNPGKIPPTVKIDKHSDTVPGIIIPRPGASELRSAPMTV